MDSENKQALENIKSLHLNLHLQAIFSINRSIIDTYWNIGKIIALNEKKDNLNKFIDYLSNELSEYKSMDFSTQNLFSMLRFYQSFTVHYYLSEKLSWSHYKQLIEIEDENERYFFIIECASNQWNIRELEKRINNGYYKKLYSSNNMALVRKQMQNEIQKATPEDLLNDPDLRNFINI